MKIFNNKITPNLWFDEEAEEAAAFYISIFSNSMVVDISRYSEAGPGKKGSVMTVTFELEGQSFVAINGGPHFSFTPAISFLVDCESQEEVDELWEKLSDGGEIEQCGWLRDKFGVSWQIVPNVLYTLLKDPDPVKAERVMQAMLQMKKINIVDLKKAYSQ
ncbi:VOC family protein [Alteribacillus sp. HJP-4]|uniref:VOC family protein n=1 Tax=Alteribacillus sp. HJP-4 TaxID=2775394 RepID=UPI0035CCF755